MKLKAIQQEVYNVTRTKNTKQLKTERSDLTAGRDLRYEVQGLNIIEQIKSLQEKGLDISLNDLQESEQMLKESLFIVGRIAGLKDKKIEIDWQRIQLETQLSDIHIEEL